jgi:S-adenosylmethionine uptake transporter
MKWAYLAALAAVACFVCMDVLIKLLSPRYGAVQLAWLRFASGSALALLLWGLVRALAAPAHTALPDARSWRLHLLRGVLLIVSISTYFFALKQLPLITAVTVSYIAPVFVAVLAMVFLRERPDSRVWLALALGFAGVSVSGWAEHSGTALLAQADRAHTLLGIAAGVTSALAFAGVLTVGRLQAQRDPPWTLLLVQNLLAWTFSSALLAAAALAASATTGSAAPWFAVPATDWPMVAAVGLFATGGVLCLTYAFARLEANRVAPLEYTGLVWAAVLGHLVLGEQPDRWDALAALLVLAGCLVLIRFRTRLAAPHPVDSQPT